MILFNNFFLVVIIEHRFFQTDYCILQRDLFMYFYQDLNLYILEYY